MNRRRGLPCRPGGYGVLVQEAVKRLLTLNNFYSAAQHEGRFERPYGPSPV